MVATGQPPVNTRTSALSTPRYAAVDDTSDEVKSPARKRPDTKPRPSGASGVTFASVPLEQLNSEPRRSKNARKNAAVALDMTIQEQKKPKPASDEPFDQKIQTASSAHVGKRENQQDALYVTSESLGMKDDEIFAMGVLCDGMGGMSGGEQASALAVELFNMHLLEAGTIDNMPQHLTREMNKIDAAVYGLSENLGIAGGMGTTLVAVIVINSDLYWASVGDSRIYILRGNEILQVTRDHNYMLTLNERVLRGEMIEEEAHRDPQKEALISYMGMGGLSLMDINKNPFTLVDGDIVLLSSDGLFKTLSDEEMLGIVKANSEDLDSAADALISTTIGQDKEHQDNASCILIKYIKK